MGLGVLAFCKGIRLPNAWPYTHVQLDYSTGFIRRGLFGATLGHWLHLNLYGHFAVVSTALLLLLLAALVLLARSSKLAERMPPGELLAVYASSYGVSYLASLNGYLDIPLALLCVAPLFVQRTGWRLAAAACTTVVGILIHEQFFFAFLPLLIVSVLFGAVTAKTAAERRLAWIGGALLAVLGLGLMMNFVRQGAISATQANELTRSIERTSDRPLDPEVFKVLLSYPRENFETMKMVRRRSTYLPAQVESLLHVRSDGSGALLGDASAAAAMDAWEASRSLRGGLAGNAGPTEPAPCGMGQEPLERVAEPERVPAAAAGIAAGGRRDDTTSCAVAAGMPAGNAAEHGDKWGDAGQSLESFIPIHAQSGCGGCRSCRLTPLAFASPGTRGAESWCLPGGARQAPE